MSNTLCFYKFYSTMCGRKGICNKEGAGCTHNHNEIDIANGCDVLKNYDKYIDLKNRNTYLSALDVTHKERHFQMESRNLNLLEQLTNLNSLTKEIDEDCNKRIFCIEKQLNEEKNKVFKQEKYIVKIEKELFQEKNKLIELEEQINFEKKKNIILEKQNNNFSEKIEKINNDFLTNLNYYENQTKYYLDLFEQQNKYYIIYCENQEKHHKDQYDDFSMMMKTSELEDKQQLLFLKLENDKLRVIIDKNYEKISSYDKLVLYYNTITTYYSILQEEYKKLLNTNTQYEKMTEFNILLNSDKKILMLKEGLTKIDKSYHKNINDIITKFNQIKANLKMLMVYKNQLSAIPDELVKEISESL